MKLNYVKTIGGHPVQDFLNQAVLYERDALYVRHVPPTVPAYDQEAVFITEYENIIGAMAFDRADWNRSINIQWSFVKPENRLQGVHTALFQAVHDIALRDGYRHVFRSVSTVNENMIVSVQSQGGVLVSGRYHHDLYQGDLRNGRDHRVDSIDDKFNIVGIELLDKNANDGEFWSDEADDLPS